MKQKLFTNNQNPSVKYSGLKMRYLKRFSLLIVLFITLSGLFAQEIYLPVTVKNKQAKAIFEKAWDAFINLDFTTSNKLANQALEIEPEFFMARYVSMFSFQDNDYKSIWKELAAYDGKMTKAEKLLHEIIVEHNNDPKAPYLPGWEKLYEAYPKNVYSTIFYAHYLMSEAKDPNKAKDVITRALSYNNEWAPYYNTLGYIYIELEDYPAAEKAFNKYIELTPQYANPYDSKGDYFMAVKNYEEASKCFYKAYEIDNNLSSSKQKAENAKHLYKCEMVRPEVEKAATEFMQAFKNKDLQKHNSYYIQDGSFRYIWNGDHNFTLSEVKNIHIKQFKDWKSFELNTSNELLNIINPELAISYQNFELKTENNDETQFKLAGNFSVLWEKQENEWKVVQFIEASHEIK